MAGPKPLLSEFGIHPRLESCELNIKTNVEENLTEADSFLDGHYGVS